MKTQMRKPVSEKTHYSDEYKQQGATTVSSVSLWVIARGSCCCPISSFRFQHKEF